MAVSLSKGQRVSLDKGIVKALIGLGWDTNRYDGGHDFDLDASAFLLGSNGKVTCDEDFIFYNNLQSRNDAVVHTGDNRTGDGDGDDELISFWAFLASGDPYSSFGNMYIDGQKDGVPFCEADYQIKDSEDIKIAEAFQTAEKIYVDEESQAIIVKGDSGVYQLKVKDGEIQCSKIE